MMGEQRRRGTMVQRESVPMVMAGLAAAMLFMLVVLSANTRVKRTSLAMKMIPYRGQQLFSIEGDDSEYFYRPLSKSGLLAVELEIEFLPPDLLLLQILFIPLLLLFLSSKSLLVELSAIFRLRQWEGEFPRAGPSRS